MVVILNITMKLSAKQLRRLVQHVFTEGRITDEVGEQDLDMARQAEYGLDMLHIYFDDPELRRAHQTVMQRLYEIQESGTSEEEPY